jgi:hypothetical protein
MNAATWSFSASVVTALGLLVMYFASKRHTEEVEDSNSLATSIKAIGDAAVGVVTASSNVSTFVQSMMEPLKQQVEANRAEMLDMEAKHGECSGRIDHLEAQMGAVLDYVRLLRGQVRELGGEPHPPPDPLTGFTFD